MEPCVDDDPLTGQASEGVRNFRDGTLKALTLKESKTTQAGRDALSRRGLI